MRFASDPLPDDVETLRRMVQERNAEIAALDDELTSSRFLIEKLKLQIARGPATAGSVIAASTIQTDP